MMNTTAAMHTMTSELKLSELSSLTAAAVELTNAAPLLDDETTSGTDDTLDEDDMGENERGEEKGRRRKG
jgi:hypothetical protein